jgi:hypothetical protein
MMRLYTTCIASVIALASAGVGAVELNADERQELRERAEGLHAERERNPSWDGGTRRLNEPQGDVRLDRQRGEVKMKSTDGKRKGEPATNKVKRAAKNLPGALVRKR